MCGGMLGITNSILAAITANWKALLPFSFLQFSWVPLSQRICMCTCAIHSVCVGVGVGVCGYRCR